MPRLLLGVLLLAPTASGQEQVGSLRGLVFDRDFDAPLPLAQVMIVETNQRTTTTDQGNYFFSEVAPGTYTVVFSKDGYVRDVAGNVVVSAGRVTELNGSLAGDFEEMDEFIVQDALELAAGSEAALLDLRFDSPSLLDSISADLMSRAGAGDAASALRLVAGASVQDGKFAVIRGLPDRYVSSQLNRVRLPSADEETRAVELDQFPSPVIESIQVSKTFTPDQQGDASGGAVDIRLKRIPEDTVFDFKGQVSMNTQAFGERDFLGYRGGGLDLFGSDDGDRDIQETGQNWTGAVGVREEDAPLDWKFSGTTGGKLDLDNGTRLGGLLSLFYERDSSHYEDGQNNRLWQETPGAALTPEKLQEMGFDDFKTALFDITESSQSVQWGGLATIGAETENHSVGATYLYTRSAQDTVTLAEDTRGKSFFFPGYDPDDPMTPGHDQPGAAPYIRTETLEYTERVTKSLQVYGSHTLPMDDFEVGSALTLRAPEVDWAASRSFAEFDQPDKRQFGSQWFPEQDFGVFVLPAVFSGFKPAANFNFGNVQRIFKTIDEDSRQFALDVTLPFEQWNNEEGYFKAGFFDDSVDRIFDQETFTNAGDETTFFGDFDQFWSEVFPFDGNNHFLIDPLVDVDYDGSQEIRAWYGMMDMPLTSDFNLIAGARVESAEIRTVIDPEEEAFWFPPGSNDQVQLDPGDPSANADFSADEILPAFSFVYQATDKLTVRAAYTETVARQTFRELTPILQQEFLGGPIFIGNPDLVQSSLKNYDLRLDYTPYEGGLLSMSLFHKDIDDAIEFVQDFTNTGITYTTARNYPEGKLSGYEIEVRQDLGRFSERLTGLSIGGNATFINSEVTLPDDEAADFADPDIAAPMTTRDATNAPDFLYNIYATYDLDLTGTQLALFYTVKGDTLVAGASALENYIPNIYETEFGTLNFSLSQRLGNSWALRLQAKNLTNPTIRQVFRSDYVDGDSTRASFTRGVEFSIGITFSP